MLDEENLLSALKRWAIGSRAFGASAGGMGWGSRFGWGEKKPKAPLKPKDGLNGAPSVTGAPGLDTEIFSETEDDAETIGCDSALSDCQSLFGGSR